MSDQNTIAGLDKKLFKKLAWILVAAAFVLYGNSIMNEYALDDEFVTVTNPEDPKKPNNPLVAKGIKGIPKIFASKMVETQGESFGYRPMVNASYAVEYQFFGANPHISHFINVVLYAITAVLLFYLLLKLMPHYNYIFPLLIVIVFMAHPLHTEIVNSLKGRDELLFFMFGLVATIFYLKYFDTSQLKYVAFALGFMFLAYLSKRTALSFMGVVPLMLYFFRDTNWKKIGVVLGSFVVIALIFVAFKRGMNVAGTTNTNSFVENPLYFGSTLMDRIPVAIDVFWRYLGLMLFPIYLSFYYGFDFVPIAEWGTITVWISFVIHLALAGYALYKVKEKHIMSFAIMVYMGVLLGFSNLVFPIVGIMGERFTYIATLGFSIAVVYLVFALSRLNFKAEVKKVKLPTKVTAILLIIVGFYSIRVWARNGDWKDKLTLYRHDIEHMDNSARGHFMLANELIHLSKTQPQKFGPKEVEETLKHLKRSIEVYPEYVNALNNLGQMLMQYKQDYPAAKKYLVQALKIDSQHVQSNFNLGSLYALQKNNDSAEYYFERAVNFGANFTQAFFSLNIIYGQRKDIAKVKALNLKAVKLFPENPMFHLYLGNAYYAEQDYENARQSYEASYRVGYNLLDVNRRYAINVRLGDIYEKLGDMEKSQAYKQKASALRPK